MRPDVNPATVMTGFEQAALVAFRRIFPNAEQNGCLFYLSQCVWRRLTQITDLQRRYTTDDEFALEIRQLVALALWNVYNAVQEVCQKPTTQSRDGTEVFHRCLDAITQPFGSLSKDYRKNKV